MKKFFMITLAALIALSIGAGALADANLGWPRAEK